MRLGRESPSVNENRMPRIVNDDDSEPQETGEESPDDVFQPEEESERVIEIRKRKRAFDKLMQDWESKEENSEACLRMVKAKLEDEFSREKRSAETMDVMEDTIETQKKTISVISETHTRRVKQKLEELQEDFVCPITMQVPVFPWRCPKTGAVYDYLSICEWVEKNQTHPVLKNKMTLKDLGKDCDMPLHNTLMKLMSNEEAKQTKFSSLWDEFWKKKAEADELVKRARGTCTTLPENYPEKAMTEPDLYAMYLLVELYSERCRNLGYDWQMMDKYSRMALGLEHPSFFTHGWGFAARLKFHETWSVEEFGKKDVGQKFERNVLLESRTFMTMAAEAGIAKYCLEMYQECSTGVNHVVSSLKTIANGEYTTSFDDATSRSMAYYWATKFVEAQDSENSNFPVVIEHDWQRSLVEEIRQMAADEKKYTEQLAANRAEYLEKMK